MLFCCLILPNVVCAQRLPLKTYTVSDGLAHNAVHKIFQDAKGFLWIATAEGLSRFDGYDFTNYGTTDGLGHIYVNDLATDGHGRLWAATNGGGISRLLDAPEINQTAAQPARPRKFITFSIASGGENNKANLVNRILFDADNRLWCTTDAGLFRARQIEISDDEFELIAPADTPYLTEAAFADSRGRLWFGMQTRIIRISGGQTNVYQPQPSVANQTQTYNDFISIFEDERGQILAANSKFVFQFDEESNAWNVIDWGKFAPNQLLQVVQRSNGNDGVWWLGTNLGLIRGHGGEQILFADREGLNSANIQAIFSDREKNLWLGTTGGLAKLTNASVVSYTTAQGLPFADAYRLTVDRTGNIYAQVGCPARQFIKIAADKVTILPNSDLEGINCHKNQLFQDKSNRWWFLTKRGLEFSTSPQLDLTEGQLLDKADGVFGSYSQIYEDSTDKIWLVDSATGTISVADATDSGNPNFAPVTRAFETENILRDAGGTIWLASRNKLWRWRDNMLEEVGAIEGLPALQPRSLFQDERGRLWIGTRYDGLVYTDEPEAAAPLFQRITVADGLASNTIWTIAGDDRGGVYFGTGRGLDRFDRATERIRHFTPDDGIVGSVINHLFKDESGNIWAASDGGISRIDPAALPASNLSPPIFINRIVVAGEELPLPETGAAEISAPAFSPSQNNVAIHFVGLSFAGEHALRYEYLLEGVDHDWNAAAERREVIYANLAAGRYRFLVRAVNAENIKSASPAVFSFQIAAPVWQRPWFMALFLIFAGLIIYAFYRYRVNQLLEVERTRTRIATDLHDDIGSDLSKISLLSEIVKMQLANGNAENNRLLATIAEVSRRSVDSMRDIVWAINPKRDSALEMTRKMREYAEAVFVENGVRLNFNAPTDGAKIKILMDTRRELYLIFKEAVNNAAKHATCSTVEIEFRASSKEIFLGIEDDGCGFAISPNSLGNGLANMKSRAEKIGGKFEILTQIGQGTTVKIYLPDS